MKILKPEKKLRFSDHFCLGKTQAQLDFVDIPLETDINLFLDPYALYIGKTPWFNQAKNMIVDYFDNLLGAIKAGNELQAIRLLANLREPNDARMGWCTDKPDGRGIGTRQARELYERFRDSKAVQTGCLRDLIDCELMIPGISSDKISDMTINIIRHLLVRYTQEQCELWNIPMSEVETGSGWDPDIPGWRNEYAELPTFEGGRLLLVPKIAVRRRLEANHEDYLNKEVIPFLRAEELEASSGLVRLLQDGRRMVYKKDIEEKYFNKPGSHIKNQLHEFTQKHPELLERYKNNKLENPHPLTDYELEDAQTFPRDLGIRSIREQLVKVSPGREQANQFHDISLGAMTTIFGGSLTNPKKEQPVNDGRKRIDITYNNGAMKGFFHNLAAKHGIYCPYIFIECKNYTADPANNELDQLVGRFSRTRGEFGILVCRTIEDDKTLLHRCRDIVNAGRGYVLVLNDEDIIALANFSSAGNTAMIDSFMQRKLDALLLS